MAVTPYRLLRMHAPWGRLGLLATLSGVLLLTVPVRVPLPVGAAGAGACVEVDTGDLVPPVRAADVIVIGNVLERRPQEALIRPEVYLKGPAESADIVLGPRAADRPCRGAELAAGSRVLLLLETAGGALRWPDSGAAFVLTGGQARPEGREGSPVSEDRLVEEITAITNQYAVPAVRDEGASLDLRTAVLPVTAAVLLLFAVGLVLMRIWHRIDPS